MFDLQLADDLMSARLRIIPSANRNSQISISDIIELLGLHRIIYGIDENKIVSVIESWNKHQKLYDIADVARGTPAIAGREGELEFKVKIITDAYHVETVRKLTHYWQLREMGAEFDRVDPGSVIAVRQPGVPPVPGKTVTGEFVMTEELTKTPVDLDSSVCWASESTITSSVSGVAFFTSGRVGVLPLNFDGGVSLSLDAEHMQAHLQIHPSGPGGHPPYRKEIEDAFKTNGVTCGINTETLNALVADLAKGRCPQEPILIAEGTPPINGEDGRVEFLFCTETSLKPKLNPDGSADFKSVDIVQSVSKGDEIARLIPPTKGAPGKDVTGTVLPCTNGVAARLPAGKNTEILPDKPDVLLAATDGNVKFNGNTVEISEGFIVKGDVDFSTGNIKYNKSVVVNGDVKSGFQIECGGDLQVCGAIEDAQIIVGGSLLCRQGFLGQGKGVIDAKGDVNLGFMKNQTIKSRGGVSIAREALNATIFARKYIDIRGNPLSVAGGHLVARSFITVHTAGSDTHIRSLLEVGVDFILLEEMSRAEQQLAEIDVSRRKLMETFKKYERLIAIKKKLPPKDEYLFTRLKNTITKFDHQVKTLEERKAIIAAKLQDVKDCYIRIEHGARTGTMFKIGTRYHLVKEDIIGPKTVRLIDHQIRIM
jgi:hypothetical protein